MLQRIIAPGIYLRESGLRHRAGQYIKSYGKKVYIIGGHIALKVMAKDLVTSFNNHDLEVQAVSWYGGVVSWKNINQLATEAKNLEADLIIGVGGGKALDTAKAAAFQANLPIVTIPTIAATCAAWTPLSAVYDDEGAFIELSPKAQNPNIVLVDSEIIVNAPLELLIAGIGDTLAKWFELEVTVRNNVQNAAISAAINMAKLCQQTLLQYGAQAIKSAENREITPELEQIIDANIFLSGLVSGLGGDECRAGGAHAIYNGFTVLKDVHSYYHGAIVAYGILSQLILDNRAEEVVKLIPFYKKTKLPYTLSQIGIKRLPKDLAFKVAKASVDTDDMANMPFKVTEEMVVEAIFKVDQLGNEVGE